MFGEHIKTMVDICPTIDAETTEEYQKQINNVSAFATRIHIDLGDGEFTPNRLVPIAEVWWPGGIRADLHVMYDRPIDVLDELISLSPQLITIHAEVEVDFYAFMKKLHYHGIEAGIAILHDTPITKIKPIVEYVDHLLIFSGNLGYQGNSEADLKLLDKIRQVKSLNSRIEIGWDGGVNDKNIKQIIDGGVEVINAGGYIQKSKDAQKAYFTLMSLA